MPAFELLVLAPPLGFAAGCDSLNNLATTESELLEKLIDSSLSNSNYHPQTTMESLHSKEITAINFIVRSWKQANPQPSIAQLATSLDSLTFLNRQTVEKLVGAIQQYSSSPSDNLRQPNFGQLKNFKWKIGVAIASSQCKNIYAPYVSIAYDVIQSNGTATTFTSELSFQQFKEFHSSFRRAAEVMDCL